MATKYFYNPNTEEETYNDWGYNWWNGLSGTGGIAAPPISGDTAIIQTECSINIPEILPYYIINNSLFVMYLCSIPSGYSLTNNRAVYSPGGVTNAGTITNNKEFSIFSGSLGVINNTGTFINNSVFAITNGGAFTNTGTFTNPSSGTIINSVGGTITNTSSGTFTNASTITNNSAFTNAGTFTNTGSGSITNNSAFTNTGTFTNNSTFTSNSGTFAINSGTFINNGTATIANASYLSIRPTLSGGLINNGTFVYGSKYTTSFRGEIFPQVPSSAAFGTAILF
jgi:hypothetical protein